MTTDLQNETNRNNALSSTGPTTARGKSHSRYNAVKTGIHSVSGLLPGEDADAYDKLVFDVFADKKPVGSTEVALTRQIVSRIWKFERLAQAEQVACKLIEVIAAIEDSPNPFRLEPLEGEPADRKLRRALACTEYAEVPEETTGDTTRSEGISDQQLIVGTQNVPQVPLAYKLFRMYGAGDASRHSTQIERQVVAVTKELLRLEFSLDQIQASRATIEATSAESEPERDDPKPN